MAARKRRRKTPRPPAPRPAWLVHGAGVAVIFAVVFWFGRGWLTGGFPLGHDFGGGITWLWHLRDMLAPGGAGLELWSSHWFCGSTWAITFANALQLAAYLPFAAAFGLVRGVQVGTVAYFALAGTAMYGLVVWLGRRGGAALGRWGYAAAGVAAGLAYALHPIHVGVAIAPGHTNFAPFYPLLPVAWLLALRLAERRTLGRAVALGVVFAVMVWVDLERCATSIPFLALAYLVMAAARERRGPALAVGEGLKAAGLLAVAGVAAVGLSAGYLGPGLVESRNVGLFRERDFVPILESMSLRNPLVFIDRASAERIEGRGPRVGALHSRLAQSRLDDAAYFPDAYRYYVGLAPLACLALACALRARLKAGERWLVGAVAASGFVACWLSGGVHTYAAGVRWLFERAPGVAVALAAVGAGSIAVYAACRWFATPRREWVRGLWVTGVVIVLGLAALYVPLFRMLRAVVPLYARMRNPAWFASLLPSFAVALGVGVLLVIAMRWLERPALRMAAVAAVLAVLALDYWPYRRYFERYEDPGRVADLREIGRRLGAEPGRSRVVSREPYNPFADMQIVTSGRDAAWAWLQWTSAYHYHRLIVGEVWDKRRERRALEVLGLANVEYILVDKSHPPTHALALGGGTRLVGEPLERYELRRMDPEIVRPYVQFYPAASAPVPELDLASPMLAADRARVLSFSRPRAGRIEVEVETAEPAVVMIAESWYPGWTVEVGDAPAELVRVQKAFQGVRVEPGRHRLAFEYRRPAYFTVLWGISVASAACVLALGALVLWRRRLSRGGQ